jgi:hypothetical protein
MINVKTRKTNRLSQGDILKNVTHIEKIYEKKGNLFISKIVFPLVVVLTQDCDLNQDFTYRHGRPITEKRKSEDKHLFSLIVAPIYKYDQFLLGQHLSDIGYRMQKDFSTTKKELITKNEIPRYHYLEFPMSVQIAPSVIDFKHYFTINGEEILKLKKTNFLCQIDELFREDLSQRFSWFLSRIALP